MRISNSVSVLMIVTTDFQVSLTILKSPVGPKCRVYCHEIVIVHCLKITLNSSFTLNMMIYTMTENTCVLIIIVATKFSRHKIRKSKMVDIRSRTRAQVKVNAVGILLVKTLPIRRSCGNIHIIFYLSWNYTLSMQALVASQKGYVCK